MFRNQAFIMVGSLVATTGLLVLLALALQTGVGGEVMRVASSGAWYLLPEATIGGSFLFPNFIAMTLTGSPILIALIGIGFLLNSFQIVCNCYIGCTRIMVAQGLDGLLPDWFARVNARFKTPVNAHVAYFLAAIPVIFAIQQGGRLEPALGARRYVREWRGLHVQCSGGCLAPIPGEEAV